VQADVDHVFHFGQLLSDVHDLVELVVGDEQPAHVSGIQDRGKFFSLHEYVERNSDCADGGCSQVGVDPFHSVL